MDVTHAWKILRKRMLSIALIIGIGCSFAILYRLYLVTPVYEATAKLLVSPPSDQRLDQSSMNTSIMLAQVYREMLTASTVLERVADEYPNLGATKQELQSKLTVRGSAGTQVITISVRDPSHERGSGIVLAVTDVFKTEVIKMMGVDNVRLLNITKAEDPAVPVASSWAVTVLIAFVAFTLIAVAFTIIRESLNSTYRTESELRQETGLAVLAEIGTILPRDRKIKEERGNSVTRNGETNYAGIHQ